MTDEKVIEVEEEADANTVHTDAELEMRYVSSLDGIHGRVISKGDEYVGSHLVEMGGFIPGYFKPTGTIEAEEVLSENTQIKDGFKDNKERVNFLKAKGRDVPPKATTKILQNMIAGMNDPFA